MKIDIKYLLIYYYFCLQKHFLLNKKMFDQEKYVGRRILLYNVLWEVFIVLFIDGSFCTLCAKELKISETFSFFFCVKTEPGFMQIKNFFNRRQVNTHNKAYRHQIIMTPIYTHNIQISKNKLKSYGFYYYYYYCLITNYLLYALHFCTLPQYTAINKNRWTSWNKKRHCRKIVSMNVTCSPILYIKRHV